MIKTTQQGVIILLGQGQPVVSCQVLHNTKNGLMIENMDALQGQGHFYFVANNSNVPPQFCRVAWRAGNRLRLEFIDAPQL